LSARVGGLTWSLSTQALIQYGVDFLADRGYTEIQVPHLMLGKLMAQTAQISQFDEELYKVEDPETDGDNKFLIATSEQPLSAFHAKEWLTKQDVPLK
jgi:seryl-tRNA synthetase